MRKKKKPVKMKLEMVKKQVKQQKRMKKTVGRKIYWTVM